MDTLAVLCRCCLSSDIEVSLLDIEQNVKEKFQKITSIEVNIHDDLPHNLCKDCYKSLDSAYDFRNKCLKMDEELKIQLEHMMQQANLKIEPNDTEDPNDDDVDFANNPLKQLESLIKKEPSDSDDDCYYVLVIDDKKSTDQTNISHTPKVKKELIDEDSQTEDTTQENGFEIDSFLVSDKIPDNVPATILENEEGEEYYEQNFMQVEEMQDSATQEQNIPEMEDSQDGATVNEIVKTITGKIVNGSSKNRLLKLLGSDGAILLKNADQITYLTDSELMATDDDDQNSQEIILYEPDDSSQFQILKCNDSELVIEYADEDQIAMLQQDDCAYNCDCGEQFDNADEFEKHQHTHNPGDEHLCSLCGKGFESAEILVGHNMLHSTSGSLIICPFCDTPIKRNVLTQHIKYSHSSVKPKCKVCSKTFANPNNLKRHMMIHNGIKEFQCDICFKRFHQKITMQTHRITHMQPYCCAACDQTFNNKEELESHKELDQCSKSKIGKIKEELVKTIKQVITTQAGNVLGFACSLCKKMFSVESALETHIENTHISDPSEHLCSDCGLVFPSKDQLDSHIQTHKNLKVRNSKRFPCNICGKGCSSQAMLIMHERVHTNERPFPCQLCSLCFKTKTHLRTHQLTHTREKKFGCSVCMKFFALKGNLVVHLRTHTGERPYVCSLCDEAFIDSKYLKKHKLKKHAIANLPWNQY